jgi:hypothetical protein
MWCASSLKTIKVCEISYNLLYKHLDRMSVMQIYFAKMAKFSGLARKPQNQGFIQNISSMYDAVEQLAECDFP